jgi:hypothetical protein
MSEPAADLAQRVERIEAQLAIGQLPARYVDCGRWGQGREALKAYYASQNVLTGFYRCVHLVCGQTIDLVDADHAKGTVYCRAGHEDKDHWVEMAICYFDTYVKSEGRWCFQRREEKHWYSTDWEQRPQGPTFQNWPGKYDSARFQPQLPHAWPSWQTYWTSAGDEARERVTHRP